MNPQYDATSSPTLIQYPQTPNSPRKNRPPVWLKVNPEGIPAELKARPQWVEWVSRWDGKTWKKVPYSSLKSRKASVTEKRDWTSFDVVMTMYARSHAAGVGFVLTGDDPYIAIDLDTCRNPKTGEIDAGAQAVIDRMDSYTEVSVSGTGVHIFVRGVLPGSGKRQGGGEVYSHKRYIAMTGQIVDGKATIQDRHEVLAAWYRETFPQGVETIAPGTPAPTSSEEATTIGELLTKCQRSSTFTALYQGDISAYGGDASVADLAFCNVVVLAGGTDEQIDSLMYTSNLYRDKWDRQDYRTRTVATARNGRPVPSFGTSATGDSAEVIRLRAENAELRAERDLIIQVVSNPHIGSKAPTVFRTVAQFLAKKRRGECDDKGMVRVTYSGLGDDYGDTERIPIRGRATVKRDIDVFAGAGLMTREIRHEVIDKVITNPTTGTRETKHIPSAISWVSFTGETLAEVLKPFALFAPPQAPKRSGGDRKSAAFKATRTPCPECESTERTTYCGKCGLNITETVEAEDHAKSNLKLRQMTTLRDLEERLIHHPTIAEDTGAGEAEGRKIKFEIATAPRNPSENQNVAPSTPQGGSVFNFETTTPPYAQVEHTPPVVITREPTTPHPLWGSADDPNVDDDVEVAFRSPCVECGAPLPPGRRSTCPACSFFVPTPVDDLTDLAIGRRP